MNLHTVYRKIALLLVLAGLTAGCAMQPAQQAAPTSSAPTVTFADPAARAALEANEAYYAGETATAIFEQELSTRVAYERAQSDATRAALSLTQHVDEFNAASTQQAISAAATATAVQLAAGDAMARATQTAVAMAGDFVRATQQAAIADEQRIAAQTRASEAGIAELERQTWFVVKIVLVGLLLVGGAISLFYGAKWLSVIIAIDARRRLVHERAQLVYDNNEGRWQLMPGASELPPPDPEPTRADRLAAAIKVARPNPMTLAQTHERAERAQWRRAAKNFLLWGEQIGSFSMRKMRDSAGISDPDWRAMTAFLAGFGILAKGKNNSFCLSRNDAGEQLAVGEALRDKRLIASFELPTGTPPDIPMPKHAPKTPTQHNTPHTNTHTHTHPHTRNTHENTADDTNIVKYATGGTYGPMGPRFDGDPDQMPTSGIQ